MRGVRPGCTRLRIAPYMYMTPYHLRFFVEKHSCLKKFTGQGVEKNNDDAKRIFSKSQTNGMLQKTSSVQKVGSGISSTMKGRKQPIQKENWSTGGMKSVKLGNRKGHIPPLQLFQKVKIHKTSFLEKITTNLQQNSSGK